MGIWELRLPHKHKNRLRGACSLCTIIRMGLAALALLLSARNCCINCAAQVDDALRFEVRLVLVDNVVPCTNFEQVRENLARSACSTMLLCTFV